ncbi:MAG: cysteine desulfurase-like protein [Acidimicrobiia bacterium]
MFDVERARSQFPALLRNVRGAPAIFADGPGGTQVPDAVIDAMAALLRSGSANLGGPFATSEETEQVVTGARSAVSDLLGAASPDEIAFGQNMTSLTLAVGRALGRTWEPGDEIVVTRLDHDANVSSWMHAAAEAGAVLRFVDFDGERGTLDPARFDGVLTDRTRLVAVTHASNAIGTIVDVAAVTARAHEVGALVYVDAVHYTPHGPVEVGEIGCDFLAASAYKFFGPHTGVLYGRLEVMGSLDAVRIRPAPADPPGKWETGTQSFESLAGVTAAIGYLEQFGDGATRRARLVAAMEATRAYEAGLSERFLAGIAANDRVSLYGVSDAGGRTPTFAVAVAGLGAREVAERLGAQGIFVWHGHYYALEVMSHLGVLDSGGLVRIGFVHYNTADEVDRVVAALAAL